MENRTKETDLPAFLEPLRAGFNPEGEGKMEPGMRSIDKRPHGSVTLPVGGVECKWAFGIRNHEGDQDSVRAMSLPVYLVVVEGGNICGYVMSGLPFVLIVTTPLLLDTLAGIAEWGTPPGYVPFGLVELAHLSPTQPGLFD